MIQALIGGLDHDRQVALDQLLEPMEEKSLSRLAWLKITGAAPSTRNMAEMMERLNCVRQIGISRDVAKLVPAGVNGDLIFPISGGRKFPRWRDR
ncbi:hypothetical protein A6A04_20675 [Paramagnetospirillum marisnigri]|uniref:Uncharacterized protein n=1 Tax=Paramagnetospirillum marisnigri TaxID=1285242 RepID=A0A178MBR7_9PROT|nr:hypothetical protein [Paramagnetospirillum marisnigri]OAN46240.1 hypothetical protein A6A04_20675 [Paramagnetospirillum marisnigri]